MAAQQISAEAALPHFRQRCSELQDETLLLRARGGVLEQEKAAAEQRATEAEQRADGLQQQLAEARQENERLRAQLPTGQAAQPLSCIEQPDALP